MTNKEKFDKLGWLQIKNVFTTKEINNYRKLAEEEKNHKGDLLSSKLLSSIIKDERILNVIKECLDSDSLYYFGDSSLSYNVDGSGYHKDSRDRKKKDSEEFKDPNYSLIRIGVYLQDHSKHGKGLSIRSKSHKYHSVFKGKKINVESEVGDLIIWKLTTTLSGNAERIAFLPKIVFNPYIAKLIPNFIKQKHISPRMVFFACFGIDDHYAKSYIDYLKTRQYAINRWKYSKYKKEDILDLNKLNVKVYDDFDISEINMEEVSLNYKQI